MLKSTMTPAKAFFLLVIFFALPVSLQAQVTGDSRTVNEPVFPTVCTVLTAQQTAGSLNENAPDTSRIQTAINNCPVGQAVELEASGPVNAFLIQPITIKAGVTLIVDAEAIVFASINPADYSCTKTNWRTAGITAATNSGSSPGSPLMGYGIITGRGGCALTRTTNS